jgi:hypothetical protein
MPQGVFSFMDGKFSPLAYVQEGKIYPFKRGKNTLIILGLYFLKELTQRGLLKL